MKVIVIIIHHRHGEDVRVALDKKSVTRQLAKYAKENWDDVLWSDSYTGKSQQEIIDYYFNACDEWHEEIEFDVKPKRRKNQKFNWLNP